MSTLKQNTSLLERIFKLNKLGTNVQTELLAGFTTFVAMAYILFVNPSILAASGIPKEAAVAATIWTAALCSIGMGFFANLPIAMAPGMGINAFFSFYVCGALGLPWQTALGAVFISGLIFFILTVTKLRQAMISSVPDSLKIAIVAGIGLFIAFVGMQSSGMIVKNDATLVSLGSFSDPKLLLTCFGVLLMDVLLVFKVKAAIFIGIVVTGAIGMIFGVSPAPTSISDVVSFSMPDMSATFMQMDLKGAFSYALISTVFTFTVVELFDNIGTLIGVTESANLKEEDGKIKNINRALLTDSVGTMFSAVAGTSSVTSYLESTAGVNVGGKSGLTAVTVGVLFILAIIFTPLFSLIPTYATAPALILVGAMMLKTIKNLNFGDYTELVPAFLTIIMMPLSYSIASGFGLGFTSYCLLKLFSGRWRETSVIMWIIAIVFIISFAIH